MTEYYCLVAGLIDYGLDTDRKSLNYRAIREEILETVTRKDRTKLELLMGYYDIQNILNLVAGHGERYTPLGSLTEEMIKTVASILTKSEKLDEDEKLDLPKFLERAVRAITDGEWALENEIDTSMSLDRLLYTLYYDYIERNDKGFVRDWSHIDRAIRNISAVYKAKSLGIDGSKYLIGEDTITNLLTTNSASDFGLKEDVPFIDELIVILSNDNILKKESELDLLRIRIIEEMNTFNYFNINVILGYYLKIAMIERWLALDPKIGREIFEKIVKNLSTMDFTDKIAEELK